MEKYNVKFLNLAVSKDKTRPNLASPFRSETAIYATDGHRCHYVQDLEPIEKPFYLNGYDDTFRLPDMSRVIAPDDKLPTPSIILRTDAIKAIMPFLKLIKSFRSKRGELITSQGIELTCSNGCLRLSNSSGTQEFSLVTDIVLPSNEHQEPFLEPVIINASYLIDALQILATAKEQEKALIYTHEIITIKHALAPERAVIMPMRA